ncbi:hypothetical protein [Streptacidiphilus monticola]|uniref:Uncharacterized protein n=1 Tax=Streptacidiphilus monticola TaxID=2161674 RepID=A0ABW1FXX1_9ACTN
MEFEGRRPFAPRLLLAERVGWFVLERPVFLPAGCRFWTEQDALVVESPTGEQRRFAGFMNR